MNDVIHYLIFLLAMAATISDSTWEDPSIHEGRIYLEVSWQGQNLTSHSALVIKNAPFIRQTEGSYRYRIQDRNGNLLSAGWIDIPQFTAHCRIDENGKFQGSSENILDTFFICLPLRTAADRVVIEDSKGRVLHTVSLVSLKRERVQSVSPSLHQGVRSFELNDFIQSLKSERNISNNERSASQFKISLSGMIVVNGLPSDQHIKADIGFYPHDKDYYAWDTKVVYAQFDNSKSQQFSVSLKPGKYIARVWATHQLSEYENVVAPLYPYPKIITGIEVNNTSQSAPLRFTFNANNLLIGSVRLKDKSALPANIGLFDDKRNGSLLQRGLIDILPANEDGIFAVHLPPRKWVLALVPQNHNQAGELLTFVDVKKRKTTRKTFILPAFKTKSGRALKRIWPTGADTSPSAKKRKLKILFLAEAYTDLNESFEDSNGNGRWDGDLHLDENGNGIIDQRPNGKPEFYFDRNQNGRYDKPEPFTDTNGDTICNRYERSQFELDSMFAAQALLNMEPFRTFADRIEIYTYWQASIHGVQRISQAAPWRNMQTAFESFCNGTGGFQAGGVKNAVVLKKSAAILPDFTIPVLMVHDPFGILRANTFYGFGRIIMSAEDHRMGSIFVHEMGHSLGSLGDEYVYSPGHHYTGREPFEVNLTKKTAISAVKWKQFIYGFPPVPTPYDYDGYGLFEGGAYGETGIYRPAANTLMRHDNYAFGKVNEKQLKKRLRMFK